MKNCQACLGRGVDKHGDPCCVCHGDWWMLKARDLAKILASLQKPAHPFAKRKAPRS